jgi:hypothetical protein
MYHISFAGWDFPFLVAAAFVRALMVRLTERSLPIEHLFYLVHAKKGACGPIILLI